MSDFNIKSTTIEKLTEVCEKALGKSVGLFFTWIGDKVQAGGIKTIASAIGEATQNSNVEIE